MGGLESYPPRKTPLPVIEISPLDDYKDNPELHNLLSRLPEELRERHIGTIEGKSDEEAALYLRDVLEKRERATRDASISDWGVREYFKGQESELWHALETDVFTDKSNTLGRGQTARVKQLVLPDDKGDRPVESIAVKYLVKPNETTLDVREEHDLISEVEQIQKIEQLEHDAARPVESLRVPHPYFYYRHGKTQCYGMEEIKGANLFEITELKHTQLREHLKVLLKDIDREKLMEEVERFFDVMHTVCLHGDIKLSNFMISSEGKFYLIDFGQSIYATHVDDNSQDFYDELKIREKTNAKKELNEFLNTLNKE